MSPRCGGGRCIRHRRASPTISTTIRLHCRSRRPSSPTGAPTRIPPDESPEGFVFVVSEDTPIETGRATLVGEEPALLPLEHLGGGGGGLFGSIGLTLPWKMPPAILPAPCRASSFRFWTLRPSPGLAARLLRRLDPGVQVARRRPCDRPTCRLGHPSNSLRGSRGRCDPPHRGRRRRPGLRWAGVGFPDPPGAGRPRAARHPTGGRGGLRGGAISASPLGGARPALVVAMCSMAAPISPPS